MTPTTVIGTFKRNKVNTGSSVDSALSMLSGLEGSLEKINEEARQRGEFNDEIGRYQKREIAILDSRPTRPFEHIGKCEVKGNMYTDLDFQMQLKARSSSGDAVINVVRTKTTSWRKGTEIQASGDIIRYTDSPTLQQMREKAKAEFESQLPEEKDCPFCAEKIKLAAIKCRYCGSDISPS